MISKQLLNRTIINGFATFGRRLYVTGTNDKLVTPLRIMTTNLSKDFVLTNNIHITQRAEQRLDEIYKESKELLSIMVESGGCHGFQYNLKLIPETDIKDLTLQECLKVNTNPVVTSNTETSSSATTTESDSATQKQDEQDEEFDEDFEDDIDKVIYVLPSNSKVCVDTKSLAILNGTSLTYTTELIGSSFKIQGGEMKSSCGCGSSFNV